MPAADALFPPGFVWGASTSAYQIEGAVREDGRGPSIWDSFSHSWGKIADGSSGDVACDSYRRYSEDIALMRELGLGAYRLSLAWPRIVPEGRGRINDAGLDHYRRLIDALHAAGIEPFVTLYHWDLPQPLQDAGGWTNRDTALRFGEYAHAAARALGPGVHRWMTINEPFIHSVFGHLLGIHAPGMRGVRPCLAAGHHLLLAHAEGMDALRAEMAPGDEAGIALILAETAPASDSAADLEAAERADVYANQWFLDPIFRGVYPAELLRQFGDDLPEIRADDLRRIAQPIDFLGVNHYQRAVVKHALLVPPIQIMPVTPEDSPTTASGWEVYPRGIYDTLTRVHRDYAPRAIYVTENGAAYDDRPVDGVVDDPERERYLHDYLLESLRAVEAGVPLRGYFVWSLLDNFEWNEGYRRRFGLVYVDFATQQRTIKRSGHWYAQVTRDNGVTG
jgi:beta-glucosidase